MPSSTVLEASREGDWPRLLELLPTDLKAAEERDDWSRLPLHYAALQTPGPPLEVFQRLLEAYPESAGAPLGWDEMEQLAYDYAVEKQAPDEIVALLKEAADGKTTVRQVSLGAEGALEEVDEEGEESESGRTEALSLCSPMGRNRAISEGSNSPFRKMSDTPTTVAVAAELRSEMRALKAEMEQTALYIVDEVEARLKAHKEDWMGRLQAQQVVLEGSLQAQTELQAALEGSLQAQTAESDLYAGRLRLEPPG
jgi:septal ring factor EnvC (AmiA/AmiB activator)